MPDTQAKLYDNVYRFPGENRHLALQANEVAFTGRAKHSGWLLVAIGAVAVVAALVAMGVNAHV